jgi:5-(carboxyamino)imidazole ribonucleotide synthase
MLYGILGSGQLAWMLSLAAKKSGHTTKFINTNLIGEEQAKALLDCDVVTFESEFLDYSAWRDSLATKKVYPHIELMEKLSDKWEQKQLFEKFQLPTAKAKLIQQFPSEDGVAKWSRQGYDGYGNLVIDHSLITKDRVHLLSENWKRFVEKSRKHNARIYFEELISFQAECALVVGRDINGRCLKYPLLITEQKNSVCNWAFGPASRSYPEINSALEEMWPRLQNMLNSLSYVGVLAFELFWVDHKLLINEVAPRVHNSGHITLDAFNWSQFDLHLKAIEGFGDIELVAKSDFFMMKNILGDKERALRSPSFVDEDSHGVKTYWYGKKEIRPGRKMGHINFCGASDEEVREILKKKEENLWQKID